VPRDAPADGGIRFGQYLLLRRIARGGMAEVFLAQQRGFEGFDRRVAVKRILPHLADAPDFIKMFLGEAKLAAQLSHPNIVHIYDFGKVAADYFIAMEFVDGVHAGQIWKATERERISPAFVARIGADAATALHYAHEQRGANDRPLGLVHRDVSPANIMISYDGVVKLCDFGIAKAAALGDQLTNPGQVKGKYAYMSPEQTTAAPLDGRSDVFSLGICLWELLAGKTIVGRGDAVDAMRAIRDGKLTPIERAAPWTPTALAKAIGWALQTRREDRPTAMDFAQALEAFLKATPELATPLQLGAWVRARFPRESTVAPSGGHGTAVAIGTDTGASAPEIRLIAASRASAELTSQNEPIHTGALLVTTDSEPAELAATTIEEPRRSSRPSSNAGLPPPNRARSAPRPVFAKPEPDAEPTAEPTKILAPPYARPTKVADAVDVDLDAPTGPRGDTEIRSGAFRQTVPSGPPSLPTIVDSRSVDISFGSGDFARPSLPPQMAQMAPRPSATRPTRWIAIAVFGGLGLVSFIIALAVSGRHKNVAPPPADAAVAVAIVPDAPKPDAQLTIHDVVVPIDAAPMTIHDVVAPPDAAEPSIDAQGAPLETLVEVSTKPEHATVQIGADRRVAPTKFALPAGHYVVTATLDGWEPEKRELELVAGDHVLQEIAFDRRVGTKHATRDGKLTIRTSPYSEVFLGDRDLGTAPFADLPLPPGTYTLTFKNPLHKVETRRVTIAPGKTTKLGFSLP
jgi:serine/threonine-protein kinase